MHGQHIEVPGDISSAAFFIVAALITPNSEITINNVGINDTRAGILKVCQDMGADITLLNAREEGGEPVADLLVKTSSLRGTIVEGDIILSLIHISTIEIFATSFSSSILLYSLFGKLFWMIATASSASSSATVKEISFVPLRPTDCKIISTLMLYFARALKRWNAIPGSSFNPTVSYTHLDVYKRQVLAYSLTLLRRDFL